MRFDYQTQKFIIYNIKKQALNYVAQWVGRRPTKRKVMSSIPTQGTCLGCGFGPQLGSIQETTNQ